MTSKIGGRNVTISPLEQRLLAECKDAVLWKRSTVFGNKMLF